MMGLGLVASGKRSINAGTQYNGLFDAPKGEEIELLSDGDVHDTIGQMKKIVNSTLSQTKAIAKELKGSSTAATAKNVWDFLYHHVQYKKDNPLREQLRTPARTWKDRTAGVDCDCYSIFISSVLTNLKIPHAFRMAAYKDDFQHVYVVVPKNGKSISDTDRSSYYVIDPVVNKFNYEVPYSKKHDTMRITSLNGIAGGFYGFGACENTKPVIQQLRPFMDSQEVIMKGGIVTEDFLIENGIPYSPAFNQNEDRSVYMVPVPNKGVISVPTVMSPTQAEELKTMTAQCALPAKPSTTEQIKAAAKKFNWWWIAAIAAGVFIITGSDQQEVQPGIAGVKAKDKADALSGPAKSKKKKKAVKAISI